MKVKLLFEQNFSQKEKLISMDLVEVEKEDFIENILNYDLTTCAELMEEDPSEEFNKNSFPSSSRKTVMINRTISSKRNSNKNNFKRLEHYHIEENLKYKVNLIF